MKRTIKILLSFTAVAITGILIYKKRSEVCNGHMLRQVADEGYETAHDVLFPDKKAKGSNLQYGPVLPAL